MDKQQLIRDIIAIEWEMFHNVNGEDRVSCQTQPKTFEGMRSAQYMVWSEETLASYLEDIGKIRENGGNIAREKYIRMMKSTSPEEYEILKRELPPVSEEKEKLVEEIWGIALEQTKKMREEFPKATRGGRVLTAAEETHRYPSVETYQKSELLTYSEKTLALLLADIKNLQKEDREFFREVQENSIRCMGYQSMEALEKALK